MKKLIPNLLLRLKTFLILLSLFAAEFSFAQSSVFFDGADDRVSLSLNGGIPAQQVNGRFVFTSSEEDAFFDRTFEAWVYPTAFTADVADAYLFHSEYNSGGLINYETTISCGDNGKVQYFRRTFINSSSNCPFDEFTATTPTGILSLNTWQHLSITENLSFNGGVNASLVTKFYINGVLVHTDQDPNFNNIACVGPLWPFPYGGDAYIGNDKNLTKGFSGYVDELRLYQGVLNPTLIANHYNIEECVTGTNYDENQYCYFKFNNSVGSQVDNHSIHDAIATLENGAILSTAQSPPLSVVTTGCPLVRGYQQKIRVINGTFGGAANPISYSSLPFTIADNSNNITAATGSLEYIGDLNGGFGFDAEIDVNLDGQPLSQDLHVPSPTNPCIYTSYPDANNVIYQDADMLSFFGSNSAHTLESYCTGGTFDDVCGFGGTPNGYETRLTVILEFGTILPVELLEFRAKNQDESVYLQWNTSQEQNNSGFEVQHSTNDSDWRKIDWVVGAETSFDKNSYETIDRNPATGTNYYRLKQIDFDGKFEYSPIVAVDVLGENNDFVIAPNPVALGGTLSVQLSDNPIGEMVLYNALGAAVAIQPVSENQDRIELSLVNLPKGIYSLVFATKGQQQAKRVVIQ